MFYTISLALVEINTNMQSNILSFKISFNKETTMDNVMRTCAAEFLDIKAEDLMSHSSELDFYILDGKAWVTLSQLIPLQGKHSTFAMWRYGKYNMQHAFF